MEIQPSGVKSSPLLTFRLGPQWVSVSNPASNLQTKSAGCVFILIVTGIWPQCNLDTNSKLYWLFYNITSCSYITGDLVPVQGKKPSIWIFFCSRCTYIIYKKTTSIFQTMVCKQFLSNLSLLEKRKSCINTMESTDTGSIQWIIIIIYRTYQVTVALDV